MEGLVGLGGDPGGLLIAGEDGKEKQKGVWRAGKSEGTGPRTGGGQGKKRGVKQKSKSSDANTERKGRSTRIPKQGWKQTEN